MYKKHKIFTSLVIAILILLFQTIYFMTLVNNMQGNARVVNYTGIVRGATQRLVKNELYNYHDDKQITNLDNIIIELKTGEGEQNLTVLKDEDYLSKLDILSNEWDNLKHLIYIYRSDSSIEDKLYITSEHYFKTADNLVTAAEHYSDGIAKKLKALEITITLTIIIMLIILLYQLSHEIKNNRILNKIAYIDCQTGLPNKRGCEEKMRELLTLDSEKNICCILFDINNLKYANDNFGHLVGDALITSFASLLRRAMPESMFVGRFGGDEFIAIGEANNPNDIETSIEKLKKAATQTVIGSSDNKVIISFAYGIAYSNEYPSCTIKTLMDIADKNMYQNKIMMKAKNKKE